MKHLTEFFNLITASDGRLSSNAMREGFFVKRNASDLWYEFLNSTELYSDLTITQRVHILRAGEHTHRDLCATCGSKPVQFLNGKLSKFCCKGCASKSPTNKGKWKDPDAALKRRIQTNLERYGVEQYSQTQQWKSVAPKTMSEVQTSEYGRTCLNDPLWLTTEYVVNQRSVYDIADELDVHYCTVLQRIDLYNIPRQSYIYSIGQLEMSKFISDELDIPVEMDVSGYLYGKRHIDIYVPEFSLGIEYNGLYHHSVKSLGEVNFHKDDHIKKTISAENNGIQLLHFTDDDWKSRGDIVRSMIRSKLNKTERIFARKCSVVEISKNDCDKFLNETNLYGSSRCSVRLGLVYMCELVAVMTFSVYKKYCKLERFSSKLDVTVVGGFSKLLSRFRKLNRIELRCIVNRATSTGHSLFINGLTLNSVRYPVGTYNNSNSCVSWVGCNATQCKKVLGLKYRPELSPDENMYDSGYRLYFDCGNYMFKI